MNAKQLERASYMAAHAILCADTHAARLACPGARRSYMIDVIADTIKNVFELHCSALDDSTDWGASIAVIRRPLDSSAITPEATGPARKNVQRAVQELH